MATSSDDELTRSLLATDAVTRAPVGLALSRTPSLAPGAILAGRYRLVALLGRGGMGEVYRADDLTLDQPIALKFLPESAAGDEPRLNRLHNELRVARQVSHRNVCRLYDLGEADGRRFLTMEYVDGEDLASLLRRIGRIPHDKAVQIARQLCAGVAAAHERGIVHRDLKPANVMIDGEGNVRITDFGIASAAGDDRQGVAGTPLYMAPEQLSGGAASVRSDIYALGLVLFEIFTGRRAVAGETIADLKDFHRTATVTTPSSIVPDLDPAVERVIMRCLEHDPERRPASALVVAAALPGADPLAAALAAGETPSPEILAAAGEAAAVGVAPALAMVALTVVGLVAFTLLSARTSITGRVPLDLPPAVLADRAQQVMVSLGHTAPVADRAYGFMWNSDYSWWLFLSRSGPGRYEPVARGDPSAVLFWYRTSPRTLRPSGGGLDAGQIMPGSVTAADPPVVDQDMRLVVLDGRGRLRGLRVIPPDFDEPGEDVDPPQWDRLFEAAGWDISAFVPVASAWTPQSYTDARAAWEGVLPGSEDIPLRLEAGAYRGRPVSLAVKGPWSQSFEVAQQYWVDRVINAAVILVIVGAFAAAAVLARRNLRASRADRRGAARLAGAVSALGVLAWLFGAHHTFDVAGEFSSLFRAAANIALLAVLLWAMYLAFEPYVRRLWPDALLGWSRLLAGHVRDPRVGRDILIGLTAGVTASLIAVGRAGIIPWLGYDAPIPGFGTYVPVLDGPGSLTVLWILATTGALQSSFTIVVLVVLVRLVLRRVWLSTLVTVALLSGPAIAGAGTTNTSLVWLFGVASGAVLTLVLFRFGLLAFAVTWFTWTVLSLVPMMPDVFHWSAAAGNWTVAALIALAAFGFYAARTGQPLFGAILKE